MLNYFLREENLHVLFVGFTLALLLVFVLRFVLRIVFRKAKKTVEVEFSLQTLLTLSFSIMISVSISFSLTYHFRIQIEKFLNITIGEHKAATQRDSDIHDGGEKLSGYIYDTDPQNNAYIIGSLSAQQLEMLDKILEHERYNNGLRLVKYELEIIADNNAELITAYLRWRKCKDLMRSYGKAVYPSERKFLHYYEEFKKQK